MRNIDALYIVIQNKNKINSHRYLHTETNHHKHGRLTLKACQRCEISLLKSALNLMHFMISHQ